MALLTRHTQCSQARNDAAILHASTCVSPVFPSSPSCPVQKRRSGVCGCGAANPISCLPCRPCSPCSSSKAWQPARDAAGLLLELLSCKTYDTADKGTQPSGVPRRLLVVFERVFVVYILGHVVSDQARPLSLFSRPNGTAEFIVHSAPICLMTYDIFHNSQRLRSETFPRAQTLSANLERPEPRRHFFVVVQFKVESISRLPGEKDKESHVRNIGTDVPIL